MLALRIALAQILSIPLRSVAEPELENVKSALETRVAAADLAPRFLHRRLESVVQVSLVVTDFNGTYLPVANNTQPSKDSFSSFQQRVAGEFFNRSDEFLQAFVSLAVRLQPDSSSLLSRIELLRVYEATTAPTLPPTPAPTTPPFVLSALQVGLIAVAVAIAATAISWLCRRSILAAQKVVDEDSALGRQSRLKKSQQQSKSNQVHLDRLCRRIYPEDQFLGLSLGSATGRRLSPQDAQIADFHFHSAGSRTAKAERRRVAGAMLATLPLAAHYHALETCIAPIRLHIESDDEEEKHGDYMSNYHNEEEV